MVKLGSNLGRRRTDVEEEEEVDAKGFGTEAGEARALPLPLSRAEDGVEEVDGVGTGGRMGTEEEVEVEVEETGKEGGRTLWLGTGCCCELLLDPDATPVSTSSSSDESSLLNLDLWIRPRRAPGEREGRGCSHLGAGGGRSWRSSGERVLEEEEEEVREADGEG